jgi:UDP-GlcNAc:undecaprenyl-phosphate GlcNAc-1-phosphate transferase
MTLQSLIWFVAGSILPSLVITWLATFVVRRLASKYGLVDQPGHRKVHVTPTPLGGGLAIGCGVILPFVVGSLLVTLVGKDAIPWFAPDFVHDQFDGLLNRLSNLWVILAGAAILMIVGLLDDRRGLDWRWRLGIQFAVASVCVATQGWELTAFIQFGRAD